MKIIKSTLVAGLISILSIFSANAEKVKIGDPATSVDLIIFIISP